MRQNVDEGAILPSFVPGPLDGVPERTQEDSRRCCVWMIVVRTKETKVA